MGQPPLESTIHVAATPDEVWAAVSQVRAMPRRSPELVGMWLFGKPRVGRRGINLNRRKGFAWPTFSRITQWKPPGNDNGRSGGMNVYMQGVMTSDDFWSRIGAMNDSAALRGAMGGSGIAQSGVAKRARRKIP